MEDNLPNNKNKKQFSIVLVMRLTNNMINCTIRKLESLVQPTATFCSSNNKNHHACTVGHKCTLFRLMNSFIVVPPGEATWSLSWPGCFPILVTMDSAKSSLRGITKTLVRKILYLFFNSVDKLLLYLYVAYRQNLHAT